MHRPVITGTLLAGLIGGSGCLFAPAQAAVAYGTATTATTTITTTTATATADSKAATATATATAAASVAATATKPTRVRVLITSPGGTRMLLVRVLVFCRVRGSDTTCNDFRLRIMNVVRYREGVRIGRRMAAGITFVGERRFRMRVYRAGNKIVDRRALQIMGAPFYVRGFALYGRGALELI